jgi:hypothetical protein
MTTFNSGIVPPEDGAPVKSERSGRNVSEKDGHRFEGRPDCGRASRFIGESEDGYLVELAVAARALAARSGTTPSCCMRPKASQLT